MECENCKYFRGFKDVFTGMCTEKSRVSKEEHGDFGHGLKIWFEGEFILPSKTNRKNYCDKYWPKDNQQHIKNLEEAWNKAN